MYFNTCIFNIHSSEDTLYKYLKPFWGPRRVEDGLKVFTSGVIADKKWQMCLKSRAEIGIWVNSLWRQDFSLGSRNAAHKAGDKNIQDLKFTVYWFCRFLSVGICKNKWPY